MPTSPCVMEKYMISQYAVSVESDVIDLRTLKLLVSLIHSCTKASNAPICPDIENNEGILLSMPKYVYPPFDSY